MKIHSCVLLLIGISVFTCCASYKKQYSREGKQWQLDTVLQHQPTHVMYLVGDAGNDSPEKPAPVLTYLSKKLGYESDKSSIVFLGDNIYEYGMPPKEDSAKRAVAEYRITSQLEALDNFQGRPVFVPGNHDWRGWGLKGLKRQEKFVEKYLNSRHGKKDKDDWENYFLPDNGCSGAEVVELDSSLVLLVIDTEWWLRDWNKESGMNEGCEVKNRATFAFTFENLLRKYRNKNVVVAMHHPLWTYGSHGGAYNLRQHIFPLTDVNERLYIPLPGIGSFAALYRGTVGSRQDVAHHDYQALRRSLLAAANKNGNFIFVAGHEHTLQYIENERQTMVVSGAGSKTQPVKLGKGSQFAAGVNGYVTLNFYKDGECVAKYYEVSPDGQKAMLVFQKKIRENLVKEEAPPVDAYGVYQEHRDTIVAPLVVSPVRDVGGFHNFLLGKHHRSVYQQQYPLPVMDLATFKGGLTPIKLGGGNQTNSLRTEDQQRRQYVLRGIDKDASRFLPHPFNQITAARYVVEDNFFATHPFAPLAVPHIAEAINVYHTNPKLFYVPAQPRLAPDYTVFANRVSLVEERPAGKHWKHAAFFGNPDKIIGTDDLIDDMLNEQGHYVDQSWMLRTRLLDLLIGDWDRHDDQWAWSMTNQEDGTRRYRPIPRDRDQAFSKYDGFTAGVARNTIPFMRQLQIYGPNIYSYKWNTWSARLVDRTFLTQLAWSEWEAQVRFAQERLTDNVIENAFVDWPAKARELTADHIIKSMKQRRNDLMVIARAHYEFISKSVDVLGTEERERFVVEHQGNGHTKVTAYNLSKNGKTKGVYFERVFDNSVTRVVNIYGNGSDDEFVIRGNTDRSIKVKAIGGMGKDVFVDSSIVTRGSKRTIVYDNHKSNKVIAGPETRVIRTNLYRFNAFDRRGDASNYNIAQPLPVIGLNPDDGPLVGMGYNITRFGFKKEPYASMHRVNGSFAFATQAFRVGYTGDFINAFGGFDFYLDTYYKGPTFSFNYAGLGNDSERPVEDADYYRVRQSELRLHPAVKKRIGANSFVTLGPTLSASQIQDTKDRYITNPDNGLPPYIFDRMYYAGGQLMFEFNSVDNQQSPHSGVRFNSTLNFTDNLANSKRFGSWNARLSVYRPLDRAQNLIFATQVGTGMNIGDDYEFFQMPTVGGNQSLRGYRTERFYGKSSFYHSNDLRLRLGSSNNSTLPFTIGVFGSFDYGRVWLKEVDETNRWHWSYGGGLWLAPIDLLTVSVGVYMPGEMQEDHPRLVVKMGFGF